MHRALDYPHSIARLLGQLGATRLALGALDEAAALLRESLALQRRLGNRRGAADSLELLGQVALAGGDRAGAAALFEESMRLRWAIGHKDGIVGCLEGLAAVAAAARLRAALGAPLPDRERARDERGVAEARRRLDAATFAAAWATGEAMALDRAYAVALGADLPYSRGGEAVTTAHNLVGRSAALRDHGGNGRDARSPARRVRRRLRSARRPVASGSPAGAADGRRAAIADPSE